MAKAKKRGAMGSLEADVLRQLWAHPEGATPTEVHAASEAPLAYTTVATILTRLWQKGLAQREEEGRTFRYRTTVTEAELAAGRMRDTLDKTHDRSAALALFVSNLSRTDGRALRERLAELDKS